MSKKSKYTVIITLMLIAVMLPLSVFAGSVSDGVVTLTFPDNSIDCSPTFTVSVTGVDPSWFVSPTLTSWDPVNGYVVVPVSGGLGDWTHSWSETLTPEEDKLYSIGVNIFVPGSPVIRLSGNWEARCDEGCTPGFWKNHEEQWPIDSGMLFDAVFDDAFPLSTMFDVANLKGGQLKALGRHAVAAYLNTVKPIDYPLTTTEVVDLFNVAFASGDYNATKDLFDQYNNLVCPLG